MSKTSIRVDENIVFGVQIKQNGILTDVQGGVASLAGLSLLAIRNGESIELDPSAGVAFAKVGTVDGVYDATFDIAAMLLADGATAFVPAIGDDLKFIPSAIVIAGEAPIEGVEDSVCIIATESTAASEWSVC